MAIWCQCASLEHTIPVRYPAVKLTGLGKLFTKWCPWDIAGQSYKKDLMGLYFSFTLLIRSLCLVVASANGLWILLRFGPWCPFPLDITPDPWAKASLAGKAWPRRQLLQLTSAKFPDIWSLGRSLAWQSKFIVLREKYIWFRHELYIIVNAMVEVFPGGHPGVIFLFVCSEFYVCYSLSTGWSTGSSAGH